MKVLLLKDIFNLGRAGVVKKVADGYGRNFLLPQNLAVLATPGSMKQAGHIKKVAAEQRAVLNQELGDVAERLEGVELTFPVKAGETGRLYGSVTAMMIVEAIQDQTGAEIDRRQVDSQPIKLLGVHNAREHLTMDLMPEIKIIVHREGEPPESVLDDVILPDEVPTDDFVELQAEIDAIEAEEEAAAEAEDEAAKAELEGELEGISAEAEGIELEAEAEAELEDISPEAEEIELEAEAEAELEDISTEAEEIELEDESDVANIEAEVEDVEADNLDAKDEVALAESSAMSDEPSDDADQAETDEIE